ncbi:hypothetical protein WA026_013094 [Henosepilachna vigintioctopunctata]|uniref:Chitin-binding type-2 domain-containing protein n=1 Tax=Henosepilachna vigintioctopunctata TaxID=420089 RepID=A0AAW1UJU0_9CUCU
MAPTRSQQEKLELKQLIKESIIEIFNDKEFVATSIYFQFTQAAAYRFRFRSRPRYTTQRSTWTRGSTISRHSSTTDKPRSTKSYRRKYPPLNTIESQGSTTPVPRRANSSKPHRGNVQADQYLQSTNQQLYQKKKISDETTELSQIAFSLLQKAPLPSKYKDSMPNTPSTTVFYEETNPPVRYVSSTIQPIIISSTNRFVIKRPQLFEKTTSSPLGTYKVEEENYYSNEKGYLGQLPKYTKVVLHPNGIIECLDQGNFPHPASCKKFISCAKMEHGKVLGWEYTCPKNLSFDPIGGICNWSADLGCDEK